MADNYWVQDSYKSTQSLTQNQVVDVEYVTISTIPTGITLSYAMPYQIWKEGPPYDSLEGMATELENLVTNGHVVAGNAVSDLDANGLLADYVDLIVQYDQTTPGRPPLQGTVSIPVGIILLQATDPEFFGAGHIATPGQLVGEEYGRLAGLAAG